MKTKHRKRPRPLSHIWHVLDLDLKRCPLLWGHNWVIRKFLLRTCLMSTSSSFFKLLSLCVPTYMCFFLWSLSHVDCPFSHQNPTKSTPFFQFMERKKKYPFSSFGGWHSGGVPRGPYHGDTKFDLRYNLIYYTITHIMHDFFHYFFYKYVPNKATKLRKKKK